MTFVFVEGTRLAFFLSSLLSGPEVGLELEGEKSKGVPGFLLTLHSEKWLYAFGAWR